MRVEHGDMRAAGIDPDVERVAAFSHAGGQAEQGGELIVGFLEPDVGAFLLDQVGHLVGELGVR